MAKAQLEPLSQVQRFLHSSFCIPAFTWPRKAKNRKQQTFSASRAGFQVQCHPGINPRTKPKPSFFMSTAPTRDHREWPGHPTHWDPVSALTRKSGKAHLSPREGATSRADSCGDGCHQLLLMLHTAKACHTHPRSKTWVTWELDLLLERYLKGEWLSLR